MILGYPFTEWPILLCIGMFLFLIIGLLYGQMITANVPVSRDASADRQNTDHQT